MHSANLNLKSDLYDRIRRHFFAQDTNCEEAAFLFCTASEQNRSISLVPIDVWLLPPEAFTSRSAFYLELTDHTRSTIIKRAHELSAALVEVHSHPSQQQAEFSWSDLRGFEEFVPHVRWRLKSRPYAAFVFAPESFDSLFWAEDALPSCSPSILLDDDHLAPTAQTLRLLTEAK